MNTSWFDADWLIAVDNGATTQPTKKTAHIVKINKELFFERSE